MKRTLRLASFFALVATLFLSTSFALAERPGNSGTYNGTPSVPQFGAWADNFDSYANGTSLHMVGGWEGWNNDPNATGYVDNSQSASAPNSVRIEAAADLVHTSNVTSGMWYFSGKMYVPTAFTGQTYLIFLNTYPATASADWSAQLLFDAATNQVSSDEFGNTAPFVRGQWMDWLLTVDLDADTQSFVINGNTLYTGEPWSTSNGTGAVAITAIDLFANGSTAVYYDDIALSMEDPTAVELGSISGSSSRLPVVPLALAGLTLVAGLLVLRRRVA